MSVEIRDDRFRTIVGDSADVEKIATGFQFTEGPIWHPHEKHLIFSDMPGNHMRKWRPDGTIETFRKPSNMANGNSYDRHGRIVTCEHETSRVTRTNIDGSIEVLATHWDGKELNSPNDIVVKRDGGIYFTDPTFGRMEFFGVPRDTQLAFQGVYRIEPDDEHSLRLLSDDFAQPNGLCFSHDESRLYVNDTERGHIRVFDVNKDGSIKNSSVLCEVTGDGEGAADGMKLDSEENLYCTGPGGVHIFDTDGNCLGMIRVPEVVANFNWGEDDLCSLFMTASSSLYRVRVKIPGRTQL